MSETAMLNQRVRIEFSVDDWAKIMAAVASSRLELVEKDHLNSRIYDCVVGHDRR